MIGGSIIWASSTGGTYRQLWIRLSGTTPIAGVKNVHTIGAGVYEMTVSTVYALNVNEYVELMANQDSGGALNVTFSGNYSPEFYAVWLGE
jgi:hypothetical protein